jgi:hypothetical protein
MKYYRFAAAMLHLYNPFGAGGLVVVRFPWAYAARLLRCYRFAVSAANVFSAYFVDYISMQITLI